MRMILLLQNALRPKAILLVAGSDRMCVILRGAKDATELRLIKDQWMTEEGGALDIESLIMRGDVSASAAPTGTLHDAGLWCTAKFSLFIPITNCARR